MIAPDMATMLAFVFTDAPIARRCCRRCSSEASWTRFNAVTVDGDTSTSDTLLAFATGAGATRRAEDQRAPTTRALAGFRAGVRRRARSTCRAGRPRRRGRAQVRRDRVEGAVSKKSARRIAMSIANSPLVKTAIAGEDANWGRVVMAVGKAGEPADRDKLSIWFGGIRVAHKGARDPDYDEAAVSACYEEPEDLAQGRSWARQGPGPGAHLRSHQGICRDQWRLPLLARLRNSDRDAKRAGDRAASHAFSMSRIGERVTANETSARSIDDCDLSIDCRGAVGRALHDGRAVGRPA